MTRTFIQTDEFSRNWDEFGFTDDGLMIETIMNASDDIKRRVIAYYYLICDKDNSDKQG